MHSPTQNGYLHCLFIGLSPGFIQAVDQLMIAVMVKVVAIALIFHTNQTLMARILLDIFLSKLFLLRLHKIDVETNGQFIPGL